MTVIAHSLSALAAGALLLSAAGAASAQTPYTSYSAQTRDLPASCRNVQQLANGYVSAECQAQGGFRWSSLRPVDCRSSISNRDGVLSCTGAQATVGSLYPDQGGYGGQPAASTQQPGGIIGALFGAVFGNSFGNDQQVEDDYSQGRRPLAERRAAIEARFEAGVRDGSISRTEAARLRSDYDALVQLETRYAADGRLTPQERSDLRTRYQALAQRVGDARDDDGYGGGYDDAYGWRPLADQRAAFDARLSSAERDRRLTRTESLRLRSDFDALVRLEADYRRDGLSDREQEDLTRRLADLDRRIGDGGGYDGGYDGGFGVDPRAAQIEARIAAGERSGQISRTEAARLRDELRDLTRRWSDLEARVQIRR
ncbi:MAG: hypothetical protein ACK4VY_08620 [Brevundimonas sp.]